MADEAKNKYSNEWYTPAVYCAAARKVMGDIDLDPASSALANTVVQAKQIYTQEDNGLTKEWYGCVYLNPPFENGGQSTFARYLLNQFKYGSVEQAILLVTANTEVGWFQPFYDFPICFVRKRLNYWTPAPDDLTTHQSRFGTCFVYLGANEDKFIATFKQFGRVVKAVDEQLQVATLWDVSA